MSKRKERLSSLIQREVAELLHRKVKDPRIEGVTITRVEMSGDLHYAWIYVDFVSRTVDMNRALGALSHASGFLRGEVRQNLRLRHTPELVFRADAGLEHSERIYKVLSELKERGELTADDPERTGTEEELSESDATVGDADSGDTA
jgi:ribosome-binding factor A